MKIYKNRVISVILKILRKNGRKWQFAVKGWQQRMHQVGISRITKLSQLN